MDNQRLFLSLIFGFSLLMLWNEWHKGPQQPAVPAVVSEQPAAPSNEVPAPASLSPAVRAEASKPPAASVTVPVMNVKTDLVQAQISAQGGDIIGLLFNRHQATEDKTHQFVLFDPKHAYVAQSGLIGAGLPNHKTVWTLPADSLTLADGEQELRVRLTASASNGVEVGKTYVFHRDSYVIGVEYDIVNMGAEAVNAEAYFQLVRDDKAPEGSNSMMSTFTGPAFFTEASRYQKVEFKAITDNKAKIPGTADNGWVAMVQHYFVSAWLPAAGTTRQFYAEELGTGSKLFRAGVKLPFVAVAPGASGKLEVSLYAGPQEQNNLAKIAPGFDLVVDYGWLTVIAAPLFWVLEWLHSFTGNWGWAIILLTILIKAAFFPLSAASYKSMAKMRVLTPKMQKIKETFADDRQRMNTEMMDLYKKEKVNPLGGCLPILVQIPVFIALYWVLLGTVEMRGAPWLGWITDLTAKDPYFIMPLIMGATMFIQTKLNPTPPDPMQAKIMLLMPIVFTGMFLFFPAGLVLYWTVNNMLSIAQQWQVNRMIEASGLKAH